MAKEKCWSIKEQLPVTCTKSRCGNGSWGLWEIRIPPMSMTYDTFNDISTSLVSLVPFQQYDYRDGSAMLVVPESGLKEPEQKKSICIK